MDTLFTTAALALPIILGGLWLNLLIPLHTPARAALVWGNGTLVGLLLIPQLMWGLNHLGLPLSFTATGSLAGALTAVALVMHLFVHRATYTSNTSTAAYSSMPTSHRALFIFLLLLLVLRCAILGMEILWRPLFPWDATMHWATKARVWYEFRHMVPFVDNSQWLLSGGEGVFTDQRPSYPHTIPLLQVWMNLALGYWNTSLMNLPWLLCLIALGSGFYGQLRVSGIGPLIAMAFTYLLLSMPQINIHVALAGYADLFLGAAYSASLMAFHNWAVTRQRWQGLLAIFFAIVCLLIKEEGLPWACTLIPALLVVMASRREVGKLALLVALGAILAAILLYRNPILVSHALHYVTPFHADGLMGIIQAIWLHDNFHLLGYLFLAVIPLGLLIPGAYTRKYLGISVALSCAVGMFLFLFLFTVFGVAASGFTGVGRLCLQLAPGLLFLCALLSNDLLTRNTRRTR